MDQKTPLLLVAALLLPPPAQAFPPSSTLAGSGTLGGVMGIQYEPAAEIPDFSVYNQKPGDGGWAIPEDDATGDPFAGGFDGHFEAETPRSPGLPTAEEWLIEETGFFLPHEKYDGPAIYTSEFRTWEPGAHLDLGALQEGEALPLPVAIPFDPRRDSYPGPNGTALHEDGICGSIADLECGLARGTDLFGQAILDGMPVADAAGPTAGTLEALLDIRQSAGDEWVAPSEDRPLGRLVQRDGHWELVHDQVQLVRVPGRQMDYPLGSAVIDPEGHVQISHDRGVDEVAAALGDGLAQDGPVYLAMLGKFGNEPSRHAMVAYGHEAVRMRDPLDGSRMIDAVRYTVSDPNRETRTLYYWPEHHRFSIGDGDWTQEHFDLDRGVFLDPRALGIRNPSY